MMLPLVKEQAPVPPPAYLRTQARLGPAFHLYRIHPRVIRLDAAYWSLRLLAWIHGVLGAVAVIPWNPKNQKNRSCLPPT